MKFALVNGTRYQAEPFLQGSCPACSAPMIAKCGNERIRHWAHKGNRRCDPWWEETEWHRAWKNHFPEDWQEQVMYAENGEKHIADVKTDDGWVIEFQHSPIKAEERDSREAFYTKLVWVIDGKRRKRDEKKFEEAWNDAARPVVDGPHLRRISYIEGKLLEEWTGREAHVLIDFGLDRPLWWLIPECGVSNVFVMPVERSAFIQALGPIDKRGDQDFNRVAKALIGRIARYRMDQRNTLQARSKHYDPLAIRPRRRRRRL